MVGWFYCEPRSVGFFIDIFCHSGLGCKEATRTLEVVCERLPTPLAREYVWCDCTGSFEALLVWVCFLKERVVAGGK